MMATVAVIRRRKREMYNHGDADADDGGCCAEHCPRCPMHAMVDSDDFDHSRHQPVVTAIAVCSLGVVPARHKHD